MLCKNCEIKDRVKYSKYSNGEFCGRFCARAFSTKNKRIEINKKVSDKLKFNSVIPLSKRCKVPKKHFINTVKNSKSMLEASIKLNIHYTTLRKYAKIYNMFNTNMTRVGIKYNRIKGKIPLNDIIYENKHPNYSSNKLRKRLLSDKIKDKCCERCKLFKWLNDDIPLELHHKDGNRKNHFIDNLQLLCPNCHSKTDTYRGKNISKLKL